MLIYQFNRLNEISLKFFSFFLEVDGNINGQGSQQLVGEAEKAGVSAGMAAAATVKDDGINGDFINGREETKDKRRDERHKLVSHSGIRSTSPLNQNS